MVVRNYISECNELPNNIVKQLFSSLWFSQEIDQGGRAWSFVVVRLRDRPERARRRPREHATTLASRIGNAKILICSITTLVLNCQLRRYMQCS